MKGCIVTFTRRGARLGCEISQILNEVGTSTKVYAMKEFLGEDTKLLPIEHSSKDIVKNNFLSNDVLIFIGSCGIAVRLIAPYVNDKKSDPAVICIDEKGKFVIPILSGHIGGANEISKKISERIKAVSVITTATDINGLIAIDEWAKKENIYIGDMEIAKKVSAYIVDNKNVGIHSDFDLKGDLPKHIVNKADGKIGIVISIDDEKKLYKSNLNLIPKVVYLGIGCKKNTSMKQIEEVVFQVLKENKISINSIHGIGTIDLKKDEKGLIDFGLKYKVPIIFYSSDELNKVSGVYTSSVFVKSVTGVDNVCERAAVLSSSNGNLIINKTTKNGVAISIALKNWRVCFEY